MDNLANLDSYQKDQLLRFFLHYMPQDQRRKLMAQLPQAYNAACAGPIVMVERIVDVAEREALAAGKPFDAQNGLRPEQQQEIVDRLAIKE